MTTHSPITKWMVPSRRAVQSINSTGSGGRQRRVDSLELELLAAVEGSAARLQAAAQRRPEATGAVPIEQADEPGSGPACPTLEGPYGNPILADPHR